MSEPLMTTQQLADKWGVTKSYLDQRRSRGEEPKWIDISAPGSKRATVRYRLEDILAYEAGLLRQSVGTAKPKRKIKPIKL